MREQSQHHLQAPAAGAQQRGLRVRVDDVGGQLGGDLAAGRGGGGQFLARRADFLLRGGDQPGVLGGRGEGRGDQQYGQVPPGGGQCLLPLPDGRVRLLAGRVICDLGV